MPLHILLLLPWLSTLAGYLQFHLPHCADLPTCLLVMHEPCALSSLLALFFFAAVLINFRFVQVLLSLPPAAAAVAGCRSCSCVWHAFNAGLRQPTSTLWGGGGVRPREIGMLQHLCQCQHCQDVRACHFARCIAWCLFFGFFAALKWRWNCWKL